jgi:DNA topoisomerase-1
MAQIGDAEDEDKKFGLMNEQNIRNNYAQRGVNFILLPKNLGEYKEAEVEVSNGRYGPYIRHGAAYLFTKRENPDVDIIVQKN